MHPAGPAPMMAILGNAIALEEVWRMVEEENMETTGLEIDLYLFLAFYFQSELFGSIVQGVRVSCAVIQ